MSVDGRGWSLPVSTLCTVLNSRTDKGVSSRKPSAKPRFLISSCDKQFGVFIDGRVKKEQMTSYAAVDLIAQCTANTTEQGTAHTAEAPATRRVVGRGRRSRGWSFRFGTLHESCVCTHRHRIWFLSCLLSQIACDFTLRRHQCLCFSRGMVPVPMVGLRASQFGTAWEVPPGDLPKHRHLLTLFSRAVPQSTPPSSRGDILACFEMEPNQGACRRRSTERSLSARCALGARRPQFCPEGGRFFDLQFWHLVRGVVEGSFLHTVVFSYLFFQGHVLGRFPRAHAVTPHHTLVLK